MRDIRGDEISMIFQEPMTSLNPLHTIEKQVGEILKLHRGHERRGGARARARAACARSASDDPEKRLGAYPHQLSGGQRQRVMIAMALANEPDLLIADEPTTALDVTIQAQILELLQSLQREIGMAMLLITHDLGIVRRMADRVYVMKQRRDRRARARRPTYSPRPQHPYTRHLLAAEPKGDAAGARRQRAGRAGDATISGSGFRSSAGLLRRTVDHVKAVDGLSLKLRSGQTLGVVGESGSGKTTLGPGAPAAHLLEGPIVYRRQAHRRLRFASDMRPLRREMQVVFQDPYGSLSPRLSVCQIIEEGLLIQKPEHGRRRARRAASSQALDEVGLDPEGAGPLSARVLRRPAPAHRHRARHGAGAEVRACSTSRPARSTCRVQAQIVDLLRDLQAKHDLAYLFISHDLKVVRALCNYVIVMRNGKVVEEGPAEEIFDRRRRRTTRGRCSQPRSISRWPIARRSQPEAPLRLGMPKLKRMPTSMPTLELKLYHAAPSRSAVARWMLEEIGDPYEMSCSTCRRATS